MLSVASCSNGPIRKRNREFDDSDRSDLKVSRGPFYYVVLESESEVSSSEEGTESICSIQNKSTDFAKDTSDTSSKTSHRDSDLESLTGVEYEVLSLSEAEKEHPFDSYSSSTDSVTWQRLSKKGSGEECDGSMSMWADGSSAASDSLELIPLRSRTCIKCKLRPTNYQYCYQCYKVRKEFFLPRPKLYRKRCSKPFIKKKPCSKDPKKLLPESKEVEKSWVESSSSHELLTPIDPPLTSANSSEGTCNVCFKNPKNGAFLHYSWIHIYACYQCSLKIWVSKKCCPLCNGKIRQVLKVAMG